MLSCSSIIVACLEMSELTEVAKLVHWSMAHHQFKFTPPVHHSPMFSVRLHYQIFQMFMKFAYCKDCMQLFFCPGICQFDSEYENLRKLRKVVISGHMIASI